MEIKIKGKKQIDNPEKIAEVLKSILLAEDENDRKKEHFWAIGLNSRNIIEYVELVSLGTINASIVHPREVFRLAMLKQATSIIISHNHPSGDSNPSEDDLAITKRLKNAGEILGIELLDHIIIGKEFYSFKDNFKI